MKVSLWKVGYTVVVLLGIAYGFVELRSAHGVSGLIQKRDEIKALEQQNQQLHKDVEAKRGRVERLRTNPEEQELEIRKRLNLVKEGEKSYILQEQRGK